MQIRESLSSALINIIAKIDMRVIFKNKKMQELKKVILIEKGLIPLYRVDLSGV